VRSWPAAARVAAAAELAKGLRTVIEGRVRAQRGRRFTCSTSREWSGELRKKGCAGRKLKCWSRLERQLFRRLCPWLPQELNTAS